MFFPAMGSTRSETKLSPRLRGNTQTHSQTHTHTQTDCYNPPPTLGLINNPCNLHTWAITVILYPIIYTYAQLQANHSELYGRLRKCVW